LDSLKFLEGSILDLPFEDESVSSLSSLCVLEHIGLGRYGDPFDPNGTEKAIEELKRVISPGGDLYVSIPIDDQNRIYFNAHRAFDEGYIIKLFDPLIVEEKRYIYGKRFTDLREAGFGIGCYHLRNVSR
jgi:SAM-dependent methyltransferase